MKTEKKEKEKERKRQASEAVEEALARRKKKGFFKTCGSLILGTITFLAMFVGAILFGAIALVVLPFLLPISWLITQIKGNKVRVGDGA